VIVVQLIKKFPVFLELKVALLNSIHPATGPCPGPIQSMMKLGEENMLSMLAIIQLKNSCYSTTHFSNIKNYDTFFFNSLITSHKGKGLLPSRRASSVRLMG
jgi:hypothetical protein